MVRPGLVVSLSGDCPDPLLDSHGSTTPGLDANQDLLGGNLLEGSPLGPLVRPSVQDPVEARDLGSIGGLLRSVSSSPSDPHDRLVEPVIMDSPLLPKQVPHYAPDMGVGVPMSAAKVSPTSDIPFQVGTISDDVQRGHSVSEGKRESVNLARLRVRLLERIGSIEHTFKHNGIPTGSRRGDSNRRPTPRGEPSVGVGA